jgi:hypothetical protein
MVSSLGQELTNSKNITLLSRQNKFIAGTTIILEFEIENNSKFLLYCSNSYGSTLIAPTLLENKQTFEIPDFLSKKRGTLSWKLLSPKEVLSGNIIILSQPKPRTLETYLGPPSIEVGNIDHTMLVVIPTDQLDNPIKNNSKVTVIHQFLKSEKKETIFTNMLIAYKKIFSPFKSGRIIISSLAFDLNSKEFDVNVLPAIATNFKLFMHRNHMYSDGNQIATLYTSVIKDKYDNIISDGSFIEFFITNKSGNILKTFGSTINGVAKAKILHPSHEEEWRIKGFFIGISESNTLLVTFKKVIEDYEVVFSKNNRNLTIGPLKSFMNQIIPDGLSVKLSIYKNNELIEVLYKETENGFSNFYLNPNIFDNKKYQIVIETAAIKKEFKNITLW